MRNLGALRQENSQLRRDAEELPRLRGEIARLRAEAQEGARSNDVANGPMKSEGDYWLAKADALKQRLEQMPDKRIPELQLLEEQDWLLAAKQANLESDGGTRRALNALRTRAKAAFAEMLRRALRGYASANAGQLPGNLFQLKPYFASAIDDAILQRYELLRTGQLNDVPREASLVSEKAAPVDEYYDSHYEISGNGAIVDTHNLPSDTLLHAYMEFSAANNGREPADPAELQPYVKTPEEGAELQKLIQQSAAGK